MRKYVELIELREEGESDFMRIDVTDWSEEDVSALIAELRRFAAENYVSYVIQIHYCHHDEGGACEVENI